MGTLTTDGFVYLPSLGAKGAAELALYDAGQQRVDTRLGRVRYVGDPTTGYDTFAAAVATLNALGTNWILVLPRGAHAVSADLTVNSNIHLVAQKGADIQIATTKTLTINGGFEAGLYQVFSWAGTGKVVFGTGAIKEAYLQWWGAQSGLSYDCSAALTAAATAIGTGQTLRSTDGTWRIASPVTILKAISMKGVGAGSCIYIDVGAANDGITFGDINTSRSGMVLDDISFVGPANACKNGLVINQMHRSQVRNVFVCMGAVEYGVLVQGTIYSDFDFKLLTQPFYPNNRPANGVKFTTAGGGMQSNVVNLRLKAEAQTGNCLYIGDDAQTVFNVSGSIEYCTGTYAIYAKNVAFLNISDLYGTDGNTGNFYYENCNGLRLTNVHTYGRTTELVGCWNSTIDTSDFGILSIDPTSHNTTIGNIALSTGQNGLQDAGQNTVYTGGVKILSIANFPIANYRGNDQQNVITNANFERWQSDRPDGWGKTGDTTWTKCGDGLGDTTRRGTRYCAQSSVNAVAYNTFALDADVKKQTLGNQVTFSAWIYHAAGQNPSVHPYFWVSVTDGGDKDVYTYHATRLSAATDGAWRKVTISCFVPLTATNVQVILVQNVPAGGGTNILYLSEPCLFIGANPPSSYAASRPQGTFLETSGQKITFGAAAPTTGYRVQGDVQFNSVATVGQPKSWACTVAGTPGTWVSEGIIPGVATTPAVPASTVEQRNTHAFPVRVTITGGTVTVIAKGPTTGALITTGATTGAFILEPNEYIAITYSVAPTWAWLGM